MVTPRSERTRSRILDAAERLFLEHGFNGAGMEAVAEAADVSRQAVYDKFGSKGGLLRAMTERIEERLGIFKAVGAVAAEPDGLRKLTTLCDLSRVSEPGVAPFVRVLYAARFDDETAAALWNDRMTARYMAMRHVVEQLDKEGRLRPGLTVEMGADILWSILNPLHYDNLVVSRGWSIDNYRRHIEVMARAGLLGEAPPPVP
ncbi:MAG: TetR/AcrR family transcriptional regulator [Actinomycetota bacterium]|nr:TetR/AcrR family transcriptional regulator [Actinomycetota bacterium]